MPQEEKSRIYFERNDQDEVYFCHMPTKQNLIFSHVPSKNDECVYSNHSNTRSTSLKNKVLHWMKEVFLPQGYPHSVSEDYLEYQMWDSLQAYCSNLAGALSLHATLVGMGVGQDSASPLAAAISWLTKDGTGMVSSIAFAYSKGSELDNNSKQWRLFADIVNDGALFLRLLAPVLPFPFLLVLCCSSMMSSLVGVAGGATRASLIQHQARCNNMADVSAKDGSQETLVNLAGLISSITLLPILTSSSVLTWASFVLFVSLHLYTNYKGMSSIQMDTLNRPRLLYIFNHLITRNAVPDIPSTNHEEPLLLGPAFRSDYLSANFQLELGVSLSYVKDRFALRTEEFKKYLWLQNSEFQVDKYMLFLDDAVNKIYVVYHEDADNSHYLQSFWCAFLCAMNLQKHARGRICTEYEINLQHDICDFVVKAKEMADNQINTLTRQISEKGWLLDPLRWKIGSWRIVLK